MTVKRFDLPDPPPPPTEHVAFEIAGRYRDERDEATGEITKVGEPFVEQFRVVDYVPFAALDDLAQTVRIEDGKQSYGQHATLRYMRRVIVDADRERWEELLLDPTRLVPIENIVDVMLWVVATTAERPTGPQSISPGGSAETSRTSEGDSSSEDAPSTSSPDGPAESGSTSPSPPS